MSSNSKQDEKISPKPVDIGVEIPFDYRSINLRQTYASLNTRDSGSDTDSDPSSNVVGTYMQLPLYLNHLTDTEGLAIDEGLKADSKEATLEFDVSFLAFNLRDLHVAEESLPIFGLFAQFPKFALFEDVLTTFKFVLLQNTDKYHQYGFLIRMIEHALDNSIALGEWDIKFIDSFSGIEGSVACTDLAIAQILFSLVHAMCSIMFPNLPDHLAHFNLGAIDTKIDYPSKMITLHNFGGTRSPFLEKEGVAPNTLLPGNSIFKYNFLQFHLPEQILALDGMRHMQRGTAVYLLYRSGFCSEALWTKTMQYPGDNPARLWWVVDDILVRRDKLAKDHPCYKDFEWVQSHSKDHLFLPDECPSIDFDELGKQFCLLPEFTSQFSASGLENQLPNIVQRYWDFLPTIPIITWNPSSLFSLSLFLNILAWLYAPISTCITVACTTVGLMTLISMNDWVVFSFLFAYALSCSKVIKDWWRFRLLHQTNACFEKAARQLDEKLGLKVFSTAYGYVQFFSGTIYAPILLIAIGLWLLYMFVVRPKREKKATSIVLQAKNDPKFSHAIDYLFVAFVSLTTFCGVYEMSNMKGVVDTACKMSSFHNLVGKVTKLVGSEDMSLPAISKFSINVRSDVKHILTLRNKIESQAISEQWGVDEELKRTECKALFKFFKQKKYVLKRVLGTQAHNTEEWIRSNLALNTFTSEKPLVMNFILRYKDSEKAYQTITVEQVKENYARLGFIPELIKLITVNNLIVVREKPGKVAYTKATREAYLYEISADFFEYNKERATFVPPDSLCAMPTVQGFVNHFINKYGAAFALFTIGFVLAYVFYKLMYPWLRRQFIGESPVLEGNMTKAGFPKPRKAIEIEKWQKTKQKYNVLRNAIGLTPVEELEDKVAAAYLQKQQQKQKPLPTIPVSVDPQPTSVKPEGGRDDGFGGKSWYDIMQEEEHGLGTMDYSDENLVDPFTLTDEQQERFERDQDERRDGEYYERQQMDRALQEFKDNNDVSQEVKKKRVKVAQGTITYNGVFDQISGPKGLINEAKPLGPQIKIGDFVEYKVGLTAYKGTLKQITKRGWLIQTGTEQKWMRPKQVKVLKKVRPEAKCPNSEPWVDALADHSYFLHDLDGALIGAFTVVSGAILTAGHVLALLVHGDMEKQISIKAGTKVKCYFTTYKNASDLQPLLLDFLCGFNDAKRGMDFALLEPISGKHGDVMYKKPALVSTNIMSAENYKPESTYSVQVYGVTDKGIRCPFPGTVVGKIAKYTSHPGSSGTGVYDSVTQNLLGIHVGHDQELQANIYQPMAKLKKSISAILGAYRAKNGQSPSPH